MGVNTRQPGLLLAPVGLEPPLAGERLVGAPKPQLPRGIG
jgi:hypothetical protein